MGATQAHASTGRERFVAPSAPGSNLPSALAPKVVQSLFMDSTGNRPIDPTHCQVNADGCATPNDLLIGYQQADPDYGLVSVNQLSDYMTKNLIVVKAPVGQKYWMACLKLTGKGTHKVVWNCLAREFHARESAIMSKKTGKIVQAYDCANPVGVPDVKKIVEECDEIDFYMRPGEEVHIGWLGHDALPDDKCNALMKAGETEWSYLLSDECPRDRCDFSRPSQDLGLPVQAKPRISFVAETAGWHKLRLTRRVEKLDSVFVFCLIWPGGYQSTGTVISKTAYATYGRAYIQYPTQGEHAPADWHGLPHTWQNSGERIMRK